MCVSIACRLLGESTVYCSLMLIILKYKVFSTTTDMHLKRFDVNEIYNLKYSWMSTGLYPFYYS